MKRIVVPHVQYVKFDPGELQTFMDAKGIELTAEQISDRSKFYPEEAIGILEGKFVISEDQARELAKVLKVPFEELFGRVFG